MAAGAGLFVVRQTPELESTCPSSRPFSPVYSCSETEALKLPGIRNPWLIRIVGMRRLVPEWDERTILDAYGLPGLLIRFGLAQFAIGHFLAGVNKAGAIESQIRTRLRKYPCATSTEVQSFRNPCGPQLFFSALAGLAQSCCTGCAPNARCCHPRKSVLEASGHADFFELLKSYDPAMRIYVVLWSQSQSGVPRSLVRQRGL